MSTTLNIQLLARLRKETQVSMVKAREALIKTNQNYPEALKWVMKDLSNSAAIKAEKVSSRTTNQGVVSVAGYRQKLILELGCETDYVAKTPIFTTLANRIATSLCVSLPDLSINMNSDKIFDISFDAIRDVPASPNVTANEIDLDSEIKTINQIIIEAISQLGENIGVKRISATPIPTQYPNLLLTGSYLHGGSSHSHGRLGAILTIRCNSPKLGEIDYLERNAKRIAQHIVGMNPRSIEELMSQDYLFGGSIKQLFQEIESKSNSKNLEITSFQRFG